MGRHSLTPKKLNFNISYELYRELAGEICEPINDKDLSLQLRHDLYNSKLTYLYNIQDQCFRSINLQNQQIIYNYTQDDLLNIKNAIEITKVFLIQTIKEALAQSINKAGQTQFAK